MIGGGNCRLVCVLCTHWQSLWFTAAKGYFPECEFSSAIRREDDSVSVRRPGQTFYEPPVVGDLPRSASSRGDNIDIADRVIDGANERNLPAVGGESRI